jgi:hypothetical protein
MARNLAKWRIVDIVPRELISWVNSRELHLGAISDTTAMDGDLVVETNPPLPQTARLVHCEPHPLHLRLLGSNIRG